MNGRRAGFSLVEMMIVVAILGLLAAIAIPQLSNPKEEEKAAAMVASLGVLRTAIDSYWSQHDSLPGQTGAAQLSSQLCRETNPEGRPGTGADFTLGPYIPRGRLPQNTLVGTNTVLVVDSMPSRPSGSEAWIYDRTSGDVRANVRGESPGGARYFDL